MNEVKVYDSDGNLKKVISVNQLNLREKNLMDTPSMFRRNNRTVKPPIKLPDSKDNTGKP
jgi:hypothetical protein